MMPRISDLARFSGPLKTGLTGAGIAAVIFLIIFSDIGWIVFVGLVTVALFVLLYRHLLKWRKKRKGSPMERDLMEHGLSTPRGVSEPSQLARLDELRKQFVRGIENFHKGEQSLYSVPWYLVIGEPGSGKTEAIRHSNVGFPPNLHDELQGVGGTLNMDWWFTNNAVILDTAGRLLFEEVETGGSLEWREFLNLLKKYRPRCPINGVLLVIPADSLIKDTADQIGQKASKIARQLDTIQRALDVRFPVFVVITKSDLINGFRDFFDNLDDPDLQGQILGWSNPAPLDEPYNPDFIDRHLKVIRERLVRRRFARIQEAIADDGVEKTWSVDTLYAFPQSLSRIAPRMARYLELIFSVGGKWSKPLFFRGIYFTSSMRVGSALDEDLAESLGVSVDSLPDGRAWERDRSFFLRDLFIKKVFPEQGLVTQARNAKSEHIRRKMVVRVSAAASAVLVIVLASLACVRFKESIGNMEKYFRAALVFKNGEPPQLQGNSVLEKTPDGQWEFAYDSNITPAPETDEQLKDVKKWDFSAKLAEVVGTWEKKRMSWISKPAGIALETVNEAQATIYEANVLKKFVGAASAEMEKQKERKEKWPTQKDDAEVLSEVLHHFLRIRAGKPLDEESEYYSSKAFLDPLARYVWRDDSGGSKDKYFDEHEPERRARLHQPLSSIYGDGSGGARVKWPPKSLKTEPNLVRAIEDGIELFTKSLEDPNQMQVQLGIAKKALNEFNAAEEGILRLRREESGASRRDPYTVQELTSFVESWKKSFGTLQEAKECIDRIDRDARDATTLLETKESFASLWKEEGDRVRTNCAVFLNELKDVKEPSERLRNSLKNLQDANDYVHDKLKEDPNEKAPSVLDSEFWTQLDGRRLYEIRYEIYKEAHEQIDRQDPPSGILEVVEAVERTKGGVAAAKEQIKEPDKLLSDPKAFRLRQAVDIAQYALDMATQKQIHSIVEKSLTDAPKKSEEIKNFIANAKGNGPDAIAKDIVVDGRYDPSAGAAMLRAWKFLGETISSEGNLPDKEKFRQIHDGAKEAYDSYAKDYLKYWLEDVPTEWIGSKVPSDSNWADQRRQLEMDPLKVRDGLEKFGNSIRKAVLDQLGGYISDGDGRVKKFRDNMNAIRDDESLFNKQCERMLRRWAGLSDNAFEARKTLLRCTPPLLGQEYFVEYSEFPVGSDAGFADVYYNELARVSLRKLADEIQLESGKACRKLKEEYGGKFPLAAKSEKDLDLKELKEARYLLGQVLPLDEYGKETVGGIIGSEASMDTNLPHELLKSVYSPKVPENQRPWLDGIKQLFEGLPKDSDPYYCRIGLLNRTKQEKDSRFENFNEFRIVQGDKYESRGAWPTDKDDEAVATVEYPGDPIRIDFYKYLKADVPKQEPTSLHFPGRWACLRMLHKYFDSENEAVYIIKLADKKLPPLKLKLEFCRRKDGEDRVAFPAVGDWPSRQE